MSVLTAIHGVVLIGFAPAGLAYLCWKLSKGNLK